MNGRTQLTALPGGEILSPAPDTFWHTDWLGSVRLGSSASQRTITFDRAFAPFGEMYNTVTGGTANPNFTGDTQDTVPGEYDTRSANSIPTRAAGFLPTRRDWRRWTRRIRKAGIGMRMWGTAHLPSWTP